MHSLLTFHRNLLPSLLATMLVLSGAGYAAGASESTAWSASFADEFSGDFSGALSALDPLRAAPADPYLLAMRSAWLEHRLGKEEAALVAYGQAGGLKPTALEPHLGMITSYLALKRFSEAEISACTVLKAAPGHYLASCGLIAALLGAGRVREAADLAKPLVEHFPADATVLDLAVRAKSAVGDGAGAAELAARLAVLKLAWGPQLAQR